MEKSAEQEPGLDDDETVLLTVSAGMRDLCAFGSRKEAERAREVGILLEKWLTRHSSRTVAAASDDLPNGVPDAGDNAPVSHTDVPPIAYAVAHRAIGISLGHWASVTYEASSRAEIRGQAIKQLQKAISPELEDSKSVDSLFTLSLLLAETRNLRGAVEVLKEALMPESTALSSSEDTPRANGTHGDARPPAELNTFERERKLIPLWHLLALILSARQDYASAAKSCEAAFEQFINPEALFGRVPRTDPAANDEKTAVDESGGLVEHMTHVEKEALVQTKMTQLALMEVLEGPEQAVNASDDLLGLYGRLFGSPTISAKPASQPVEPPKSSSGTLRSFRGTLLGRSKSKRRSVRHSEGTEGSMTDSEYPRGRAGDRTSNQGQVAPSIQVTDEAGGTFSKPRQDHDHAVFHPGGRYRGEKLQKRSVSGSLNHRRSVGSFGRKRKTITSETFSGESALPPDLLTNVTSPVEQQGTSNPSKMAESEPARRKSTERHSRVSITPSQVGIAVSADVPSIAPPSKGTQTISQPSTNSLAPVSHNLPRDRALPYGEADARQDVRLPTVDRHTSSTHHEPRFPRQEERRMQIGLLTKVWLLIAGLYRRAKMSEDAKGAIDEATELIEELDPMMRGRRSNTQSYGAVEITEGQRWGSVKHVEELWADVWAEVYGNESALRTHPANGVQRGHLARAQSSHYKALGHFEQALSRQADHASATVGLCEILLDISSQTIPPEPPTTSVLSDLASLSINAAPAKPDSDAKASEEQEASDRLQSATHPSPLGIALDQKSPAQDTPRSSHAGKSPQELNRLAARDRAHGLLSSLTKLGTGWDLSEAWFALARAYEQGGQVEKAREVLWWCVELEDAQPVRDWRNVSASGYVL